MCVSSRQRRTCLRWSAGALYHILFPEPPDTFGTKLGGALPPMSPPPPYLRKLGSTPKLDMFPNFRGLNFCGSTTQQFPPSLCPPPLLAVGFLRSSPQKHEIRRPSAWLKGEAPPQVPCQNYLVVRAKVSGTAPRVPPSKLSAPLENARTTLFSSIL